MLATVKVVRRRVVRYGFHSQPAEVPGTPRPRSFSLVTAEHTLSALQVQ